MHVTKEMEMANGSVGETTVGTNGTERQSGGDSLLLQTQKEGELSSLESYDIARRRLLHDFKNKSHPLVAVVSLSEYFYEMELLEKEADAVDERLTSLAEDYREWNSRYLVWVKGGLLHGFDVTSPIPIDEIGEILEIAFAKLVKIYLKTREYFDEFEGNDLLSAEELKGILDSAGLESVNYVQPDVVSEPIRTVDLKYFLMELSGLLEAQVFFNVSIVCESEKDGLKIDIRKREIEEAIWELVKNARDLMPRGGVIRISCSEFVNSGRCFCRLVVTDAGPGIKQADLPKIFDLGFTGKGERGTGNGLYIAKHLVEKNGGLISVDSKLGVGTSFEMVFPRHIEITRVETGKLGPFEAIRVDTGSYEVGVVRSKLIEVLSRSDVSTYLQGADEADLETLRHSMWAMSDSLNVLSPKLVDEERVILSELRLEVLTVLRSTLKGDLERAVLSVRAKLIDFCSLVGADRTRSFQTGFNMIFGKR